MGPDQRVTSQVPLTELWDENGPLKLTRQRTAGKEQIADLLRQSPVRFVVANSREPLKWVALEDRFRFWKEEVQPHLIEPDTEAIHLEAFPGGYCYLASVWGDNEPGTVVVLEKFH